MLPGKRERRAPITAIVVRPAPRVACGARAGRDECAGRNHAAPQNRAHHESWLLRPVQGLSGAAGRAPFPRSAARLFVTHC
eukprot:3092545-Prymnesium_polylepis.1